MKRAIIHIYITEKTSTCPLAQSQDTGISRTEQSSLSLRIAAKWEDILSYSGAVSMGILRYSAKIRKHSKKYIV